MENLFGRPVAYARLQGGGDSRGLRGLVRFYQNPGGVLVEVSVRGLPRNQSGFYALHIHNGRSCLGPDFPYAGTHYNPANQIHPLHAGDLPPLLGMEGRAYMAVLTDRFSIGEILGHTVVIHEKADDFHTQPSGNPGEKIACGVIVKTGRKIL